MQALERFHADVALQLLDGVRDLTASFPSTASARLKDTLTELILSTSLETHFEFMERVRNVIRVPPMC
jgi:3'5'-cyclic nucleotide phosphodiesterase